MIRPVSEDINKYRSRRKTSLVRHYCLSIHRKEALCDHTLGKAQSMTKCQSSGMAAEGGILWIRGRNLFRFFSPLAFLLGRNRNGERWCPNGKSFKIWELSECFT